VSRFDAAHAAVHNPADRRFRAWIRPSILIGAAAVVGAAIVAAWVQFLIFGLPTIPRVLPTPSDFAGPHGFLLWVRYSHFFNFLFVTMLVRSGLSILVDHPRLYFNDDCTPGSEWLRVTPLQVPTDRLWTAKDDARYISPWFALPGYRHTIGVARAWHVIDIYGFIVTGVFFVVMLFATEQWKRIVPTLAALAPLVTAWSLALQ
jgi:methionine sulfoxide reductase catalytic subunit